MTDQTEIRQTENNSAGPQGHTVSARNDAERQRRAPMVSWAALLDEAVKKPGFIHEAYSRFHNYSLGNQLLVLYQCSERALRPWKDSKGEWQSHTDWHRVSCFGQVAEFASSLKKGAHLSSRDDKCAYPEQ
jgi:hypothetical protein